MGGTYLLSLKRRSFMIEADEEACWSWVSAGGMMDNRWWWWIELYK